MHCQVMILLSQTIIKLKTFRAILRDDFPFQSSLYVEKKITTWLVVYVALVHDFSKKIDSTSRRQSAWNDVN